MERLNHTTRIISGAGSLSCLAGFHIKRLLIVADPFFAENGSARRIAELSGCEATEIFSRVTPDPSVALVAEGTKVLQDFRPDTVLALGGGSAMDCAKAMVCFSGQMPFLIAVPTTSGSGAEVTDFAILTHEGTKHPLVDPSLRPNLAILDSTLLTALPKGLIADSGFDLIVHALESWVARDSGPISRALAGDALAAAMKYLPLSFAGEQSARLPVHIAATMAGMAFSASGLGLCHAISHSLGGQFHVPHGRLNAILLPAVMACNAKTALADYACLARRLRLSSGADPVAFRALKNALSALRRQLHLPGDLASAGISPRMLEEKADAIISAALADPCCAGNPLTPSAEEIRRILREVMGHG